MFVEQHLAFRQPAMPGAGELRARQRPAGEGGEGRRGDRGGFAVCAIPAGGLSGIQHNAVRGEMCVQCFCQCGGFSRGDGQCGSGEEQAAAALQLQMYRVGAHPEAGCCRLAVDQRGECRHRPVELFLDFEGLAQPGFNINGGKMLYGAAAAHAAQIRCSAGGQALGAGGRQQVGDEQGELHVLARSHTQWSRRYWHNNSITTA